MTRLACAGVSFAGLLLLLAATGAAGAGQVLCVKPGGGDGCSATVQAAFGLANAGDTVRVAAGIYVENVVVDKNVTLEGGWSTDFTVRDPALFESILEPSDPGFSVVDIEGSIADPASSTPVLDGFTIRGGGEGFPDGGNHGGGIRIRDSNATVRSCLVTGNRGYLFGGGIWVQRGAPRIEQARVEGNVVAGGNEYGGGIEFEDAQGTVIDTVVRGNATETAGSTGGGIAILDGGPVRIAGGSIEDNQAPASCPTDVGYGGGIAVAFGSPDVRIERVRFSGNCAGTQGDALWLSGGTLLVTDSAIAARSAGVAITNAATTELRSLTLAGPGDGFGVLSSAPLTLTNSIVSGFAQGVVRQLSTVSSQSDIYWNNTEDTFGFPLDPSDRVVDPLLDASLHLGAGSPAIDTGKRADSLSRDVDGDPRVMDGGSGRFRIDVGADEFAGRAQRNVDLAFDPADLAIVGPGQPPENPDSGGSNDWIGFAALARDVSGDGLDDLVISAQDFANDFDTDNAGGRLFGLLHFGERRTGVRDLSTEPADFEVTCDIELQHLGQRLVSGDLDDDGALDLVAGASDTHDEVGTAYPKAIAFFGGPELAANGAAVSSGALGDFALVAAENSSNRFASINGMAIGDLSGDGVDDLVVGDSSADAPTLVDAGAAYVMFGGTAFGGVRDLATTAADATFFGTTGDGTFASGFDGGGVAVGDLDHDGQPDLVIRERASAWILFGPFAGGARAVPMTGDTQIEGLDAGGLIVLDMTGDGVDDVVVESAGTLLVFAGPLAHGQILGTGSAAYALHHDPLSSAQTLAAADVLGDPSPELLVGDPAHGTVLVVSPGLYESGPIDEIASWIVTSSSNAAARNLGWDVAGGDLDGDGRDDLVATAWQTEDASRANGFRDVGKAFVFYGDPCGDGKLAAAETCDDANIASGDGCSALCSVETDYVCDLAPSVCGLDVQRLAPGMVMGSTVAAPGDSASAKASVTSQLDLTHTGIGLTFWLSLDGLLDAGDLELGGCFVPSLASGSTHSCDATFTLPADVPAASYLWIACVTTPAGQRCAAGNEVLVPEPSALASALTTAAALAAVRRRRVSGGAAA